MDIKQYKDAVVDLFKSGKATDEQWGEMASVVLYASEGDCFNTPSIDGSIYGRCATCNEILYGESCDHPMLSDDEIAAAS